MWIIVSIIDEDFTFSSIIKGLDDIAFDYAFFFEISNLLFAKLLVGKVASTTFIWILKCLSKFFHGLKSF